MPGKHISQSGSTGPDSLRIVENRWFPVLFGEEAMGGKVPACPLDQAAASDHFGGQAQIRAIDAGRRPAVSFDQTVSFLFDVSSLAGSAMACFTFSCFAIPRQMGVARSRSIEMRERLFTLISISDIRSMDFCIRSPAPTVPFSHPSTAVFACLMRSSEHAARVDCEDDGFLVHVGASSTELEFVSEAQNGLLHRGSPPG